MSEGTNVGSIFLDLVVRDTVEKQIRDIAAKAQAQAQQAFTGVEKTMTDAAERAAAHAARSAQSAADQVDKALHKVSDTASATGKRVETTFDGAFDKTVAMAQARVRELEVQFQRVTDKLNQAKREDDDNATEKLLDQQVVLYDRLEAARERLAIHIQAVAEKQAAAEIAAAQKAAKAAEVEAAKRQAQAQVHPVTGPPAETVEPAAQAPAKVTFWDRLTAKVEKFRDAAVRALSDAGKSCASLDKATAKTEKRISGMGQAAGHFRSRLREIVSGALIFNGISAAVQGVTKYFGEAISASSEMKEALVNLRGAAATAAAPLIEAVTPALVALTNAAAAAFSYLSRLISVFTGKSLASMAEAAKKVQTSANAAKKAMASLAGFDEIQRLGGDSGSDSGDETAEPNYDFQGQSSFLDTIMEAVRTGHWGQVGALIAQKLNESLAAIQWPDIQEKAKTWMQNFVDTINGFFANLGWGALGESIGDGFNTIITAIGTFFAGVNWQELGNGLGAGLNGLVNAVDWGAFGQLLSDRAKGALNAIVAFLEEANWQALGDKIELFLDTIDWSGISSSLFEGIGAALGGIGALIWSIIEDEWNSFMDDWVKYTELCGGDAVAGLLTGILLGLADIGMWIWDNVFVPIWDGICSAFEIHSPSKKMAEIGENIIAGMLEGLASTWTTITEFFTDSFDKLKTTITSIWEDGIVPAIKGPINSIIGFINGLISGVVSGINSVIRALNNLSFDVPDWVPGIGGQKFGFNLSTLWAPQIPYLADGGVITQPTLAMMGEYAGARNNPEIVTPQSLMAETMATVMDDVIASNIAGFEAVVRAIQEKDAVIEVDGDVLGRTVDDYRRKMAVMRGCQ